MLGGGAPASAPFDCLTVGTAHSFDLPSTVRNATGGSSPHPLHMFYRAASGASKRIEWQPPQTGLPARYQVLLASWPPCRLGVMYSGRRSLASCRFWRSRP